MTAGILDVGEIPEEKDTLEEEEGEDNIFEEDEEDIEEVCTIYQQ